MGGGGFVHFFPFFGIRVVGRGVVVKVLLVSFVIERKDYVKLLFSETKKKQTEIKRETKRDNEHPICEHLRFDISSYANFMKTMYHKSTLLFQAEIFFDLMM